MPKQLFSFKIAWDQDVPEGTAYTATSGKAVLRFGNRIVWGEGGGLHWTWVDLLAFLSENWVALLTEQIPLSFANTPMPHLLRREAEQKWDESRRLGMLTEEQEIDEEKELFYFEERHDLARSIQGVVVPSLFIVREGSGFAVSSNIGFCEYLTFTEVYGWLQKIGDTIFSRLEGLADPVAKARRDEWCHRLPELNLEIISLLTGASTAYLTEIAGDKDPVSFWGQDNRNFADSLLMTAARMGAGARLSARSVKAILPLINSVRSPRSDILARIGSEAEACLLKYRDKQPAEQGRALAQWFRQKIGNIFPKPFLDPKAAIKYLGVEVREISLPEMESDVDALSCWRPSEQPLILLNVASSRNRRSSGQKAALAHELCHILADYDALVPFAEVMKGSCSDRLEKRARGFAAELLMPREEIEKAFNNSIAIAIFVDSLSQQFDISQEIVAWQIKMSNIQQKLSSKEIDALKRFVSNPDNMGE